jgi:hypothetical protein
LIGIRRYGPRAWVRAVLEQGSVTTAFRPATPDERAAVARFELRQSTVDPDDYAVVDPVTGRSLGTGSLRVMRAMQAHVNFTEAYLRSHAPKRRKRPKRKVTG